MSQQATQCNFTYQVTAINGQACSDIALQFSMSLNAFVELNNQNPYVDCSDARNLIWKPVVVCVASSVFQDDSGTAFNGTTLKQITLPGQGSSNRPDVVGPFVPLKPKNATMTSNSTTTTLPASTTASPTVSGTDPAASETQTAASPETTTDAPAPPPPPPPPPPPQNPPCNQIDGTLGPCAQYGATDTPPNYAGQDPSIECTALANYARQHYNGGVWDLQWDANLVQYAAYSANYAASNGCSECHTQSGSGYAWGQNLYLGQCSCTEAYFGWVTNEAMGQDPANPDAGHFTNVVGFAVPYQTIGCASAQDIKHAFQKGVKNLPQSSKAYVTSLFPIASWLPRYNMQWFLNDFIAGMTVALVVIPQAISYATKLANLPAQFGLYTSFIGCLIYGLFATSKDVTIGPTAVLSLLVGQTIANNWPTATPAQAVTFAITLSFWTGLIQLFVGLFRLGLVVDFVPVAVIAGFTSGAAVQICIQQLPGLLGIKNINTNNAPYQVLHDFFANISGTSKYDAIIGVSALFFILLIKYATAYGVKRVPSLKYVGFLRNAIVLVVYTGVSYALRNNKNVVFSIVKTIPYGLSGIQQPNTSISFASTVFPAVPAIFIVSLLEHIAVVKTYGRINGYTTNANQEIIAIGLTNLLGSFVGAFPATGSFSRSAIKSASGVKTPAATFITGVLVIIALFTITNVLYWIPSAVLAAIVIGAISELFVNFKILRNLWDVEILDFIGFFIALIVTFFGSIELGIYSSVGWSLLVLLVRIARPQVSVLARTSTGSWIDPEHSGYKKSLSPAPTGILVFKIEESLTYPNSNFFIDQLKQTVLHSYKYSSPPRKQTDRIWSDDTQERALARESLGLESLPVLRAVVLDFAAVNNVDYTGLQALLDVRDDLNRYTGRPVPFHFVHVRARQLNTLVRVPLAVSASSVDATPGNPNQAPTGIQDLLKRIRIAAIKGDSVDGEAADRALQYFHFSVDEAVEAADLETKGVKGEEEETIVVSSGDSSASGFIVASAV
ncbi:hypothetical protein HDU98_012026 [Podochytrium sp. JEL0797]|nr:hypothetical protein HDU98_012026 [Podochytrium sp. JEL0797]